MDEIKEKAFNISLAYVGIGTIALFAMGSNSLMQNDLFSVVILIVNLLTLPVCFLGFGILYGDGKEAWLTALIVQLLVFALFWYLLYKYLLGKSK